MTDPIADMLTRIRNAAAAKKQTVVLPRSEVKFVIAKILEREGYLAGVASEERNLILNLRFDRGAPVVRDLKRISKPGRRVFSKSGDLPTVLSGNGIAIVSTSQGMMTNVEAKSRSLGGEVVCEVF